MYKHVILIILVLSILVSCGGGDSSDTPGDQSSNIQIDLTANAITIDTTTLEPGWELSDIENVLGVWDRKEDNVYIWDNKGIRAYPSNSGIAVSFKHREYSSVFEPNKLFIGTLKIDGSSVTSEISLSALKNAGFIADPQIPVLYMRKFGSWEVYAQFDMKVENLEDIGIYAK